MIGIIRLIIYTTPKPSTLELLYTVEGAEDGPPTFLRDYIPQANISTAVWPQADKILNPHIHYAQGEKKLPGGVARKHFNDGPELKVPEEVQNFLNSVDEGGTL